MKAPLPSAMRLLPNYEAAISESEFGARCLTSSLSIASGILDNTRPLFFPEYTDHSAQHVLDVTGTALDLITKQASYTLSLDDYSVLALAVVLHDIALYLDADGFQKLITENHPTLPFDNGQMIWPELWERFLSEAVRYNEQQLKQLFGDPTPVRRPSSNHQDWTVRDHLLIGEFIRRHHPRLAHEIAVHGFPGVGGNINLLPNAASEMRDLIGLIARSHGIPIRSTLSYIDMHFHRRNYRGIHIVFLMALLRVADYMQLQNTRAPDMKRQLRRIHSPISDREWSTHACVKNIIKDNPDPESLYVHAEPPNVETFLRIREWLDGIQGELDVSWAVLGEIYGRYASDKPGNNLAGLGMHIRRVFSNIDDIDSFSRKVDYVPSRIAFSTSSSELLSLLIGPLYGYDRFVGIREFLQNAIDAAREMADIEVNSGVHNKPKNMDSARVIVDFSVMGENVVGIKISDAGVGMTAEIIEKYFLNAGASFRNSLMWRQLHADGIQARIARGGRFGIGALAGFLLSSRFVVHTRHYSCSSNDAIKFEASLSSSALSLKREKKDCVGTDIVINLDAHLEINETADWVEDNIFDSDIRVQVNVVAPPEQPSERVDIQPRPVPFGEKFDKEWIKFDVEGTRFFIAFKKTETAVVASRRPQTKIIVNGIRVDESDLDKLLDFGYFEFAKPVVVAWDRDAVLPINLQRTSVSFSSYQGSEMIQNIAVAELVAKLAAMREILDKAMFGVKARSTPHHSLMEQKWEELVGNTFGENPKAMLSDQYLWDERTLDSFARVSQGWTMAYPEALQACGVREVLIIEAEEIKDVEKLMRILGGSLAVCFWPARYVRSDEMAGKYGTIIRGRADFGLIYVDVLSSVFSPNIIRKISGSKRPKYLNKLHSTSLEAGRFYISDGLLLDRPDIITEMMKVCSGFSCAMLGRMRTWSSESEFAAFMRYFELHLGAPYLDVTMKEAEVLKKCSRQVQNRLAAMVKGHVSADVREGAR